MRTDIERDTSRAMLFLHLTRQLVHRQITPVQLGAMCAHMFDHDISFEQRATVLAELINVVVRQHNNFLAMWGPTNDQQSWQKDQHFATVKQLLNIGFATTSDGVPSSAIAVQFTNELGQVTDDIPLWLGGGQIVWHAPFKRSHYTPDEQALIMDETLKGCSEAYAATLTKVQHMRDGENY